MVEILRKICEDRDNKIKMRGFTFGHAIPEKRDVPLVTPDLANGVVICEIKRSSPSAGVLSSITDPLALAGTYVEGGAGAISILTEEDHFSGSLDDLIAVKKRYPHMCILRKDFIQYPEEIDITYRAGADMVLLITAMFNDNEDKRRELKTLYESAVAKGLTPLVETHDENEIDLALSIGAKLIGINTRDLRTFTIDRNRAYALISYVGERAHVIFESGIRSPYEAYLAGANGFAGILAGTSLVRSSDPRALVAGIRESLIRGITHPAYFYRKLFTKIYSARPAVKLCGITRVADAHMCVAAGADMIGFIMAPSKRRVTPEKVREIAEAVGDTVLKVAVVTGYSEEARALFENGYIDAVQYHGCITNEEELASAEYPWYRAVNMQNEADYPENSISPFVLIDAFSDVAGGSGKRIQNDLVEAVQKKSGKVFIAGGITPENVGEIVTRFTPEMIDLSSGIEDAPGIKNGEKIRLLFNELQKTRR